MGSSMGLAGLFMWHAEHTLQTTAEPEAIWRRWMDVASWPEWDEALEWVRFLGPFKLGSRFVVKRHRWNRQKLSIVQFHEGRGFVLRQRRLFSNLHMHHHCEPSELGSRVTHRVEVSGLLGLWLRLTRGRRMRMSLPIALRKLARTAR